MTARVASPNSGRTIAVSVDGATLATIAVPNTGSFETYRTVSVPVTLAAGIAHPEAHLRRATARTSTGSRSRTGRRHDAADARRRRRRRGLVRGRPDDGAARQRGEVHPDPGERQEHQRGLVVVRRAGAPEHLELAGDVNPTFFYPSAGTFSPLVKITYTDGSTETVQRANYVRAT